MRKIVGLLIVMFALAIPVFASGDGEYSGGDYYDVVHEEPAINNAYGFIGGAVDIDSGTGGLNVGAGYERALTESFSIGGSFDVYGYTPALDGDYHAEYNLLAKPRYYPFGETLEGLFVGADAGLTLISRTENTYSGSYGVTDFELSLGLHTGYKFLFGDNRTAGFTLEPTLGVNFGLLQRTGRVYFGLAAGYAWGGSAWTERVQVAPAPQPAPPPPVQQPAPARPAAKDGIYIGIVTFSARATDITGGPIYLDSAGLSRLNSLVESNYQRTADGGTSMFYANHLALANMKKAELNLPTPLETATLITFTDGLDVSSTGVNLPTITDPGFRNSDEFGMEPMSTYHEYIDEQISTRTINGQGITSYVAAVTGDDIFDRVAFDSALSYLADEPWTGNSVAALTGRFKQIASDLVDELRDVTFTMITPQVPVGTRVRMTFNGERTAEQAANAAQYLEGTIVGRNREYYLTDIKYGGGIYSSLSEIKGTIREMTIAFEFPNFAGYTFSSALSTNLKQFVMNEGSTVWQINSEYSADQETYEQSIRRNAVFYLVLDQSSSIKPGDFPQVQNMVINFIQTLYDAYYQN